MLELCEHRSCKIVRYYSIEPLHPIQVLFFCVFSLCSRSLLLLQAAQPCYLLRAAPSFKIQILSPYYLPGNSRPPCSRQSEGCSARKTLWGDASVGTTWVILGLWLQRWSVSSVSFAFLVRACWNATHCIQDIIKEEFYNWPNAYFSARLFVSHVIAVTHWICRFVCNELKTNG